MSTTFAFAGSEDAEPPKATSSKDSSVFNTITDMNSSYRMHMSHCSSMSSESDLSFSLAIDREVDSFTTHQVGTDELPAFEIRLISPLGRSPSPIDSEEAGCFDTPTRNLISERYTPSPPHNDPNFVALHEINSQISPPSEGEEAALSRTSSLETIFEGVFLNTPPRQRYSLRRRGSRSNLREKVALNRLHADKENSSPISTRTPSRRIICENDATEEDGGASGYS